MQPPISTPTTLAFPDDDGDGGISASDHKNHRIKGVRREYRLKDAKRRRAITASARSETGQVTSARRGQRGRQIERRLTVRARLRDQPDLDRLARAVMEVAAEQQAAHDALVTPDPETKLEPGHHD